MFQLTPFHSDRLAFRGSRFFDYIFVRFILEGKAGLKGRFYEDNY
jgi:hypothetical protein